MSIQTNVYVQLNWKLNRNGFEKNTIVSTFLEQV